MRLLPEDATTRRDLMLGIVVALALLFTSIVFDLPYLATTVFPGLWVVLHGRRHRCRPPRGAATSR